MREYRPNSFEKTRKWPSPAELARVDTTKARLELLAEAYDLHAADVAAVEQRITAEAPHFSAGFYLGGGTSPGSKTHVFRMNPENSTDNRVVRFSEYEEDDANDVRERAEALARGLGVPRLEQALAINVEKQQFVTEAARGVQLHELPADYVWEIDAIELDKVLDTIRDANWAQVRLDFSYRNMFYDSATRDITFVDYLPDASVPHSISRSVATFLTSLIDLQKDVPEEEAYAWRDLYKYGLHFFHRNFPNDKASLAHLRRVGARYNIRF